MSSNSIFLASSILGLLLLIVSSEGFCQVPARDSTSARADSTPPGNSPVPDSAAAADTTDIPADTLRPRSNADSIKADTAAPVQAPKDSILSLACSGPAGPRTIALDLLVVVFAPEATSEERAAAADSVGGKLVSSPEPGAFYLRVPTDGDEYRLRAAADQLSLLPQVREVGNRACPAIRPDPTR